MSRNTLIRNIEGLLAQADVKIGGPRSWDLQVHNQYLYKSVLAGGSLALGQAYMAGWWDCPELDEFFYRILRTRLDTKVKSKTWLIAALKARLFNRQKPARAFQIGRRHYDIGNELYRLMLDKHMLYSCGYWQSASTLGEAQEHKLDLVCRKLDLLPGMRVLDIGCGWGGTAKFIAERYRAEVVGITVSEEQVRFGKELCRELPVDIRLQDYRTLAGRFDRILSIGMFEHVGYKNYATFMRVVRNCLKDDGRVLLQTIARNRSDTTPDPWIERYIFPNSLLPSARQICAAIEGVFILEDWHSFGPDYDKTLMQWFRNFHENWDKLKERYDQRFYRMWKYYLLSSAGSFRARRNQLWQIVLSPKGFSGSYQALRY
jgi:cyclopropane-fatty-acyl-phospholipid synthase